MFQNANFRSGLSLFLEAFYIAESEGEVFLQMVPESNDIFVKDCSCGTLSWMNEASIIDSWQNVIRPGLCHLKSLYAFLIMHEARFRHSPSRVPLRRSHNPSTVCSRNCGLTLFVTSSTLTLSSRKRGRAPRKYQGRGKERRLTPLRFLHPMVAELLLCDHPRLTHVSVSQYIRSFAILKARYLRFFSTVAAA